MDIFFLLFQNLIPLYLLIGLGWVAGRYFEVERQTLGAMAIYIIMPIVAFGFIVRLDFTLSYLALPLIFYALLSAMSFFWLFVGDRVFQNKRANLLAMTAVSTNTGYMGLPVVLSLFDPNWVAVYIFMMLGGVLHEATTMYYIAARSQFTVQDSLKKLMKFPALYAVAAGLFFNYMGWDLSEQAFTYWTYFKGAYVVVGMMIIGAALSRIDKLVIAPRFLLLTFIGQFVLWPAVSLALIGLDHFYLHIFDPQIYKLFFILAIMPPAANIAAFAIKLDLNPEKAASTVLLGTLFGLFYIPAVLVLSGLY